MACGCGKRKLDGRVIENAPNSATRVAVYQVFDSSGNIVSEHTSPGEARKAAVAAGARMRVTSKSA